MGQRRYRKKHHGHGEDGPGPERRSGHGAYGYPTYCDPEGTSDRCPSTSPSTDDSPWADTHSYNRTYGSAGSGRCTGAGPDACADCYACGNRDTCSDRNPSGDRDTCSDRYAGTNGNTGTYGPGSTDCDSGTNSDTFTHGHAGVYGDTRAHSHAGTYGDTCSCPNRLAGTDGDTCAYGHASPHGHAGSDRYTCAYRSLRKSTSDY